MGILRHSEAHGSSAVAVRPSWLEKIHQWEKALSLYDAYLDRVEGGDGSDDDEEGNESEGTDSMGKMVEMGRPGEISRLLKVPVAASARWVGGAL